MNIHLYLYVYICTNIMYNVYIYMYYIICSTHILFSTPPNLFSWLGRPASRSSSTPTDPSKWVDSTLAGKGTLLDLRDFK